MTLGADEAQPGALLPAFDGVVHFVLPAFCEADSIAELCRDIARVMQADSVRYRIIVVDDGSTDGTAERARECAREVPLTVLVNERNRGLGATLERGLRAAIADARTQDVILTMDADLTHRPEYVRSMLRRYTEGADLVIASRFLSGSAVIGLAAHRRALTTAARVVMRLCMPVPGVSDYSCGFRLYSATMLKELFETGGATTLAERGFAVQIELLSLLRNRAVCAEVPFVLRYDLKRTGSTMRVFPALRGYMRVIGLLGRRQTSGS